MIFNDIFHILVEILVNITTSNKVITYGLVGYSPSINEVFVFAGLIIHFLVMNFSFSNTDI